MNEFGLYTVIFCGVQTLYSRFELIKVHGAAVIRNDSLLANRYVLGSKLSLVPRRRGWPSTQY